MECVKGSDLPRCVGRFSESQWVLSPIGETFLVPRDGLEQQTNRLLRRRIRPMTADGAAELCRSARNTQSQRTPSLGLAIEPLVFQCTCLAAGIKYNLQLCLPFLKFCTSPCHQERFFTTQIAHTLSPLPDQVGGSGRLCRSIAPPRTVPATATATVTAGALPIPGGRCIGQRPGAAAGDHRRALDRAEQHQCCRGDRAAPSGTGKKEHTHPHWM